MAPPLPTTSAACTAALAGVRRGSITVELGRMAPTAAFGRPIASFNQRVSEGSSRTQRSDQQPATKGLGALDFEMAVARNGWAAVDHVAGERLGDAAASQLWPGRHSR
jgi:hypothetical protein